MAFRDLLTRIGPWPRRAAAIVCLLLAAVTALENSQGQAAPPAHSVRLVAATRTMPAGHILRASDLRTVRMSAVPGATSSAGRLVGRSLAGPIARGEPVTRFRLVGADLADGLPAGTVAMPVVVADDVRELVEPGMHVDVISTPPADSGDSNDAVDAPAHRLLTRVLVLAVSATGDADAQATRLVLAVDRDAALAVSGERSLHIFHVVAETP